MLVVHLYDGSTDTAAASAAAGVAPARIGFVVGRGVGGSVVRSQVTRRLRHVTRARLDQVPDGSLMVVRALGPSASATSAELGAELDAALRRLAQRNAAATHGAPA
jgi:ribonuclease P protein component